ncbi:MAG: hypothetical protein H6585_12070 [Flavobacteriales bacterium]|nr:hypothetical protein [Flavobacteriales bacterium]MCB9449067.1 hypothetical protein [Flavobacteriales bacterium]
MRRILLCLFAAWSCSALGQSSISLQPGLKLPDDSVIARNLMHDLSDFLDHIAKDQPDNPRIAAEGKAETLDLIDEIKGIGASEAHQDDQFYKPVLLNVTPEDEHSFLVQLAYMGAADSKGELRALFELQAHTGNDRHFTFSSPVSIFTGHWKTFHTPHVVWRYKEHLDTTLAKDYDQYLDAYNRKLDMATSNIHIYCCNNAAEALRVMGVSYKRDYAGMPSISLTSGDGNTMAMITSEFGNRFGAFDLHDTWHGCLYRKMPFAQVNRPVDEGCAYLYGGSWGISWVDIYQLFYKEVAGKKNVNWFEQYEAMDNFSANAKEKLITTYVINALIVQKLEKEKGFQAVMELLRSTPMKQDQTAYLASLEKLTGINKKNFNKEIGKLVEAEKQRLQ